MDWFLRTEKWIVRRNLALIDQLLGIEVSVGLNPTFGQLRGFLRLRCCILRRSWLLWRRRAFGFYLGFTWSGSLPLTFGRAGLWLVIFGVLNPFGILLNI
jgi:hypothetical protein